MTMPAITSRSATAADIPFLAWCNYEATSPYPGFCYWDPLIGGTPTLTFIEAVFRADALAWGSPHDFIIIESDGKPIAGASGFTMDSADYRPLRLDRLPAVAQQIGWDEGQVASFIQGYQQVWNDPLDPTLAPTAPWIIECVAVVPDARGRGVGKALMHAVLDAGRQRGMAHAGIAVTIGNEAAQRLYESVGFQMVVTYGAAYFDGEFPGTIKYRIALQKTVEAPAWG